VSICYFTTFKRQLIEAAIEIKELPHATGERIAGGELRIFDERKGTR